jgi:hypothetical protein
MHLLQKIDKLLDRKALAEASDLSYQQLCNLMLNAKLTDDMEYRVKKAAKKILKKLQKELE